MTSTITLKAALRRIAIPGLIAWAAMAGNAHACAPYGLIGAKWNAVKAAVGNCVNDEAPDGAGGRIQTFERGWISWDGHAPAAYAVYGLIGQKWMAIGGPKGFGHPTTDETENANHRGRYNSFEKGASILWLKGAPAAYAVYGEIRKAYDGEGLEFGPLGFPTSDEQPSGPNGDRVNTFEHGAITWTHKSGATLTHVNGTRFTYRIPHVGFDNADPVGGGPIVLTVASNGAYGFSGHFHDAAIFADPVAEKTSFVLALKSSDNARLYTFSHNGSVSVTDRNDSWNEAKTNPELTAGWADLERGVRVEWRASTRADIAQLWTDIQTAIGVAQKVVAVVGPLL